jgi:polypeptide N-acetylgalactosaminyltransferase
MKIIFCRTIPDYRPSACSKDDRSKDDLAKASVIISFYDEARSALLRTVVSVLQRTPDSLLQVRKRFLQRFYCVDEGTLKTPIPKYRLYWSYLIGVV